MRPCPEHTLGYASTIDRHEKSGGSSNLHFDLGGSLSDLCCAYQHEVYVLSKSLSRRLHHEYFVP
jgi:hypothetical protein